MLRFNFEATGALSKFLSPLKAKVEAIDLFVAAIQISVMVRGDCSNLDSEIVFQCSGRFWITCS